MDDNLLDSIIAVVFVVFTFSCGYIIGSMVVYLMYNGG